MPLFLETSPVAMRLFYLKAKKLQLPTELVGQLTATDLSRTQASGYPVFSPEFIAYFFDRENKISELSKRYSSLQNTQRELQIADASASHSYNSVSVEYENLTAKRSQLRSSFDNILSLLRSIIPQLSFSPEIESHLSNSMSSSGEANLLDGLVTTRQSSTRLPSSKSSAHVRKQRLVARQDPDNSVDVRVGNLDTTQELAQSGVIFECFFCHGLQDQHMITRCDTCSKAFHLACLDPPLMRMPKRTRLYGWQCSYCTKAVATIVEPVVEIDVNAPRRLRRSQQGPQPPQQSNSPAAPKPSPGTDHGNATASASTKAKNTPKNTAANTPPVNPVVNQWWKPSINRRDDDHQQPALTVTSASELAAKVEQVYSFTDDHHLNDESSHKTAIHKRLLTSARRRRQRPAAGDGGKVVAVIKKARLDQQLQTKPSNEPVTSTPGCNNNQTTILCCQPTSPQFNAPSPASGAVPSPIDPHRSSPASSSSSRPAQAKSDKCRKVLKYVHIQSDELGGYHEPAETIEPINDRYMICQDSESSKVLTDNTADDAVDKQYESALERDAIQNEINEAQPVDKVCAQ